jgi:hypothetical protein
MPNYGTWLKLFRSFEMVLAKTCDSRPSQDLRQTPRLKYESLGTSNIGTRYHIPKNRDLAWYVAQAQSCQWERIFRETREAVYIKPRHADRMKQTTWVCLKMGYPTASHAWSSCSPLKLQLVVSPIFSHTSIHRRGSWCCLILTQTRCTDQEVVKCPISGFNFSCLIDYSKHLQVCRHLIPWNQPWNPFHFTMSHEKNPLPKTRQMSLSVSLAKYHGKYLSLP